MVQLVMRHNLRLVIESWESLHWLVLVSLVSGLEESRRLPQRTGPEKHKTYHAEHHQTENSKYKPGVSGQVRSGQVRSESHWPDRMENQNFNSGGTGANLFAGGAQAGQAVAQVSPGGWERSSQGWQSHISVKTVEKMHKHSNLLNMYLFAPF